MRFHTFLFVVRLLSVGVCAQSSVTGSTTSTSSASTTSASSNTTCSYNGSVTQYLQCESSTVSTSTLIIAGICITAGIFAIAFIILFLVQRRRRRRVGKNGPSSKNGEDDHNEEDEEESHEQEKVKTKNDVEQGAGGMGSASGSSDNLPGRNKDPDQSSSSYPNHDQGQDRPHPKAQSHSAPTNRFSYAPITTSRRPRQPPPDYDSDPSRPPTLVEPHTLHSRPLQHQHGQDNGHTQGHGLFQNIQQSRPHPSQSASGGSLPESKHRQQVHVHHPDHNLYHHPQSNHHNHSKYSKISTIHPPSLSIASPGAPLPTTSRNLYPSNPSPDPRHLQDRVSTASNRQPSEPLEVGGDSDSGRGGGSFAMIRETENRMLSDTQDPSKTENLLSPLPKMQQEERVKGPTSESTHNLVIGRTLTKPTNTRTITNAERAERSLEPRNAKRQESKLTAKAQSISAPVNSTVENDLPPRQSKSSNQETSTSREAPKTQRKTTEAGPKTSSHFTKKLSPSPASTRATAPKSLPDPIAKTAATPGLPITPTPTAVTQPDKNGTQNTKPVEKQRPPETPRPTPSQADNEEEVEDEDENEDDSSEESEQVADSDDSDALPPMRQVSKGSKPKPVSTPTKASQAQKPKLAANSKSISSFPSSEAIGQKRSLQPTTSRRDSLEKGSTRPLTIRKSSIPTTTTSSNTQSYYGLNSTYFTDPPTLPSMASIPKSSGQSRPTISREVVGQSGVRSGGGSASTSRSEQRRPSRGSSNLSRSARQGGKI